MTQSMELVFRDSFQKKFPKIKVTLATGRGPEISQRVMSERRAEKFAVDLYISGSTSPRIFHRAKMLEPVNRCCCCRMWSIPRDGTKEALL